MVAYLPIGKCRYRAYSIPVIGLEHACIILKDGIKTYQRPIASTGPGNPKRQVPYSNKRRGSDTKISEVASLERKADSRMVLAVVVIETVEDGKSLSIRSGKVR